MPPASHRRAKARVQHAVFAAVTAGLAVALFTAGPLPVFRAAAADPSAATGDNDVKSGPDKLGSHDADLLAKAEAKGDKNVTIMIATAPGQTDKVARELDGVKGASVGRTYDRLGYVRATVPTSKAQSTIAQAAKLPSVHGIDLRQSVKRQETPLPGEKTTKRLSAKATSRTYPGPDRGTPAENPYNPVFETGAVDFVKKHPEADGRGVTIGVLDSGVDLAQPALQKTTTGDRKIVDWVTSTDPLLDGDGTWRPMTASVSGAAFTYAGRTWKAPAGSYRINLFQESVTAGGDAAGDVNRDGDTTDDWGVLYDPAAGTVTVDADDDGDFTDDKPMKPYQDGYQVGWFGTDDPSTAVSERQPFVVQIRKDVPMDPLGGDWVGQKADFVNIGIISGSHGTHVAGITAANGMFGGRMNGAAPGAKIVSSRACGFGPWCSNTAMSEGMIDLVVNRHVDVVNMSIGGLPPVNDGSSATAEVYNRLIDQYGVQIVVAGGNDGPGANTISDPGLADKVISVGASVSKETWAANYGAQVEKKEQMFAFSSGGPREDGGATPTLVAPGSAVSTIPTWQPGYAHPAAGWSLPAGYAMYQGTSMATPQTAGASALLLSAAKRQGVDLTPAKLRTALTSTARHIKDVQAYQEGAGLIDVMAAWTSIKAGATAHDYTVKAPVDTALAGELKTPGFGTGVYDREGGLKAGQKKTYDVTVTRTSGPDGAVPHTLRLKNNEGRTFAVVGAQTIDLPLNQPVTVKVQAAPTSAGIKSALLEVDDPLTEGIDKQIMTTVVVSSPLTYTLSAADQVQRNGSQSYFVTVPSGVTALEVSLDGLADGSQAGVWATNSWGVPADEDDPNTPTIARYTRPMPGVWEISVMGFRASTLLDNPYDLRVTALGVDFAPQNVTVPEGKAGTPTAVSWKVTNRYGAVDGTVQGGRVGSAKVTRPTIAEGGKQTTTVVVPEGATSLDAAIGGVSEASADLDLYVYDADGNLVAQSADGDSDESVSVADPAAGTYTIEVDAFALSGTTAYDYRDTFFSDGLGTIDPAGSGRIDLGTGDSATVSATVTPQGVPSDGRQLFGEVRVVNTRGTTVGTGGVTVEKVEP
ncbi:S8 family serine peptidase [Streptomyces spongiae]|uniref:S8 family serine peptidase n=1 Tax=Streptomyces spongiae TaxID=565072 RepID=A0A5N8X8Y3_9ACTN|nr:S8 family serine peptidase [Streptomyces spongiae]MPY55899.1 S8 family serine peptidase [Streptomyces spongiae]